MNNTNSKQDRWILEIDYSQLMDVRIDYVFKLLFSKGNRRLLISLLNAIFANKKIPRVIKDLTIKNPFFDKDSAEDKLSILDIRAELDDGTSVLIEMHLFGLVQLKSKTIRSWARAYGEELIAGDKYASQQPTIVIAFTDGQVKTIEKKASEADKDKIHRLCMIMDREDLTLFTDAMELHYIDMKAFAKAVNNKAGSIKIDDTEAEMFTKWLLIITQKVIEDKTIIENACREEEDIQMAISTLITQGKDKHTRQTYLRRQDELFFYNMNMAERDEFKRRAEMAESALMEKHAENERLRQELAELRAKV